MVGVGRYKTSSTSPSASRYNDEGKCSVTRLIGSGGASFTTALSFGITQPPMNRATAQKANTLRRWIFRCFGEFCVLIMRFPVRPIIGQVPQSKDIRMTLSGRGTEIRKRLRLRKTLLLFLAPQSFRRCFLDYGNSSRVRIPPWR
jgi:hypothetical protein